MKHRRFAFIALALSLQFACGGIGLAAQSVDAELKELERQIVENQVSEDVFNRVAEIIRKEPTNAYAHLLLGQCYEKAGMVNLAQDQYALADKYNVRPQATLEWFKLKMKEGEFNDAFHIQPFVKRRFPTDPSVRLLDAIGLHERGNMSKAEEIYKQLLADKNPPLGAATAYATLKLTQNQIDEGIKLCDRDLAIDPMYFSANLAKGQALRTQGKYADSIPYLQKAFSVQPFHGNSGYFLASSLCRVGRYQEALKPALYGIASSRDDEVLDNRMSLVENLLRVIPKVQANSIMAEVRPEIDRTHFRVTYHTALGRIYDHFRNYDAASREYIAALYFNPKFVPALFRLGRNSERYYRDYGAALKLYRTAFVLNPGYRYNREAFARLAKRMGARENDLAWRLRDFLVKPPKVEPAGPESGSQSLAGAVGDTSVRIQKKAQ